MFKNNTMYACSTITSNLYFSKITLCTILLRGNKNVTKSYEFFWFISSTELKAHLYINVYMVTLLIKEREKMIMEDRTWINFNLSSYKAAFEAKTRENTFKKGLINMFRHI